MQSAKEKKLEQLYNFIAENGFDCTIDAIASGLHVTKKTLFNRYHNRPAIDEAMLLYWQSLFLKRLETKCCYCNNALEELMLLISELLRAKKNEYPFFEREFLSVNNTSNCFLINTVSAFIAKGIQDELFCKDIHVATYAEFFLLAIIQFFPRSEYRVEIVTYLLSPLLTERGARRLNDIDLEHFFNG